MAKLMDFFPLLAVWLNWGLNPLNLLRISIFQPQIRKHFPSTLEQSGVELKSRQEKLFSSRVEILRKTFLQLEIK